jgi:uncharacterized membrane protein YdcZ (DUF606 family)
MPLLSFLLLAFTGVAAGISLATQAAVNANLGRNLDSNSGGAFVSYLGGTIVMGLVPPCFQLFVLGQMLASITFDHFASSVSLLE